MKKQHRPSREIQKELDELTYWPTHPKDYPEPGTPFFKQRRREAIDRHHEEARKRYENPEYVAKVRGLRAEHASAERSERAKAIAEKKKQDPRFQLQQFTYKHLRRLGFKRAHKSGSGSTYYDHPNGMRVRVSDHAVPWSEEREYNRDSNRLSWHDNEDSLDSFHSKIHVARWLVGVKRRLADYE